MCPSSKGEKRPADVINAAIIGKQRRHPDNSWEERVSPMTHESGARSGKWTADVRDGSRPCENVFYFPKTAHGRA